MRKKGKREESINDRWTYVLQERERALCLDALFFCTPWSTYLELINIFVPIRVSRSFDFPSLKLRFKLKTLGEHSCSAVGPSAWNYLPSSLRVGALACTHAAPRTISARILSFLLAIHFWWLLSRFNFSSRYCYGRDACPKDAGSSQLSSLAKQALGWVRPYRCDFFQPLCTELNEWIINSYVHSFVCFFHSLIHSFSRSFIR